MNVNYSCFYAVVALLLNENIVARTHDGIRNQFNLNFIKTGKIDKEFGRFYSLLFDRRQKGDYGDLFDFTEEQVMQLFDPIENLLVAIRKLIEL